LRHKDDPSFNGAIPLSLEKVIFYNQRNHEKLTAVKERFITIPSVIYATKNYFLLRSINAKLQLMRSSGLLSHWYHRIMDDKYPDARENWRTPKVLELRHLIGVFQIWILGCLIAGFVLFIEIHLR